MQNPTSSLLDFWQNNLWRSLLNQSELPWQSHFKWVEIADIVNNVIDDIGQVWVAPIVANSQHNNTYWIPLWIPASVKDQKLCLSNTALPWMPPVHCETAMGNSFFPGEMHVFDEWLRFEWLDEENKLVHDSWSDAFEAAQCLLGQLCDTWQDNLSSFGLTLCNQAILLANEAATSITDNSLCQQYALINEWEASEALSLTNCYQHAEHLCAQRDNQPLAPKAFVAAVHALMLGKGELLAVKAAVGDNKAQFIDAVVHSKILDAHLQKSQAPTIGLFKQGELYTFSYEISHDNQIATDHVFSLYQSAIEQVVALSASLEEASLQSDEAESEAQEIVSLMQADDEAYEKKLIHLLKVQTEFKRKTQRRSLVSWFLPNKKLSKQELSNFSSAIGETQTYAQDALAILMSDKIRAIKVARTKIHQQLVELVERNASTIGEKNRWHAWLLKNVPGIRLEDTLEIQFLTMQAFFAERLYTLAFENEGIWNKVEVATASCDLLIIDEAHRLLPQESLSMLSQAKSAIFIGDNQDMTALPTLSALAEEWELQQYNLADEEVIEQLQYKGMLPSNGNALTVALANGTYQQMLHGIHIAAFTLGQDEERDRQYHVVAETGLSQIAQCQFVNESQAQFIAQWLKTGPLAKQHADTVIITPFKAQQLMIGQMLTALDIHCEVFTFYELEDKQWQQVIFSPVYSHQDARPFIFDQGDNMLYSLERRSSKNIWIIGDLTIFDARMHSPSGMLAKKFANLNRVK